MPSPTPTSMLTCNAAHMLHENRFHPPGKRLPDLPFCAKGTSVSLETPGVPQCIYQAADGVTWGRTHSTDYLVRQENVKEYPPLASALRMELREPELTVVDAGANDGLSTRLFATGLPQARVVSIEPALSNYAMVLRNTRDLGPRVVALRAAVWNSSASMAVHGDQSTPWALSVVPTGSAAAMAPAASAQERAETAKARHGDRHLTDLPGITMSSLIDALCVPTLDFLKMGALYSAHLARARARAHARMRVQCYSRM